MTLTLQPIRVATGSKEEGTLVLDEEQRLVAVLVRLSDENEVAPGQWYLEAGFGYALNATQLHTWLIPPLNREYSSSFRHTRPRQTCAVSSSNKDPIRRSNSWCSGPRPALRKAPISM